MVPEIGHFALILALLLSAVQGILPIAGAARGNAAWMAVARPAAQGQFTFVAIAFGCLAYSFVNNDFSVLNVATNSNSQLPIQYRIAATWGSHEGSLLLWVTILALFGAAVDVIDRHHGLINQFLLKPINYFGYRFSIFVAARLVSGSLVLVPLLVALPFLAGGLAYTNFLDMLASLPAILFASVGLTLFASAICRDEAAAQVGDDVAMVGGIVETAVRHAWLGETPGRAGRPRADQVTGLGRVFVGRVQAETGRAAALAVVERSEIGAVAAGRREVALADARMRHHPRDERAGPWPARRLAVPLGMTAASPIVADPTAQRFAALGDAVAVGITVGDAAIDDRRAAKLRPLLPRDVGSTIAGRTFAVSALTAALAATTADQSECQKEDGRQPETDRTGGAATGRLPTNTNIDGGAVEIHV